MRIKTLALAHQLIGHRVRYMRPGGNRFGWEGVIDYANTQKVRVVWDRPDGDYLTQEYQMTSLYRENGEGDDGTTYIMILTDEHVDPDAVSTPEEDEEFERLDKKSQTPYARMVERYMAINYESTRPAPESPLAEYGRNVERLGRLLQDTSVPMQELVAAANMAGFILQFRIQPNDENGTNG